MDQRRRWRTIVLWLGIAAVLGALASKAPSRITSDLRSMLPRDDAEFAREMDFFSRQGATRLMAVEAEVADPARIGQAVAQLRLIADDLTRAPASGDGDGGGIGARALVTDDPDAAPRALGVIEAHLPALVLPEDLAALPEQLTVEALEARLRGLKERVSRPEESFLAALAQKDVLGLAGGAGKTLSQGLGGSRIEAPVMVHEGERHALLVLEIPFDASESERTADLMERLDRADARAADAGVTIEGIGAYRHFRENMAAVKSDLSQSLGIGVVLIALLLYSLIPNVRALLAMHVPAVMGMLGSLAAVVATGQSLPAPVLGFSAAILGVAVDAGQHVLVGIRSGNGGNLTRPLMLTFATTTCAFGVLCLSSVPGLRCIATMVIGGLAASLLSALFLLPAITPRLAPRDPWLRISRPLLRLAQARPWVNWTVVAVITAVLGWHLQHVHFVSELRKYDGSRPESWQALERFETRWRGEYRSSDFIVGDGAQLDDALETAAKARRAIGATPAPVEHLLPSAAEQQRRIAGWNAFWAERAEPFAAALREACGRAGLRYAAFAPSLQRYRPVADGAVPLLTLERWEGTPIAKMLRGYVARVGDGWQVALPLGKLSPERLAEARTMLAGTPAWLAIREHIGRHLVDVVSADLTWRGAAILLVILVVVWAIQRDWRLVAAQLLPSLLALAWTFGLLAWLGVELTPFAVLAAAFVAGIGIDSAVFLSEHPQAETLSPVLVASITTIAGVAALVYASHPMIAGMGRVLAVGMGFCLLACLLVTPALMRHIPPRHRAAP